MSCTKRVRETLQGLENVAKVEVDFARKTAVVAMKEGATLSKDVAVAALEEKGFQVTSFEARKPRGEAVYIATVGGMT